MRNIKRLAVIATLASISLAGTQAIAQGCVAAHSTQHTMDELVNPIGGFNESGGGYKGLSIHNLTVDIGYRVFNSNKYFIGDAEIARPTTVRNHQNIFDVGVEYKFTPRWSFIADVPVYNGTRNQIYAPVGIYQVSGLGDLTVGAQAWIFRPPTENGGNVAVSASLKIPTGIDNATGSGVLNGQTIKATADQSMQPGDGGWGLLVATQGYKSIWRRADAYYQAQYLLNPRDTNGVATFRTQPGQGVMSVTDQYLYRVGISQGVPKARGLTMSLGVRGEGVPVRDLLGDSNGFRRPGSILSLDPGLIFQAKKMILSVNGPWALHRNRPPSVPELQNGTLNGDAFFADYSVIASISHHF
ncbi:hypothetical protein [Granulicella arctica]|uniref:hypothetical protein n=1 Tax=Granulicella arctica TaxID=940613 RepID=UPI0021E04B7D|nr:hypothetical protein [Granulicella arctica]